MKSPELSTLIIAGGAFLAGALVERVLLGRVRDERRRRAEAAAQLAALERVADLLDDEFGDTLSFTGQVLNEQLSQVHSRVDNLVSWVEALPISGEYPALQREWTELQHKVHKLSAEVNRFQQRPNAKPSRHIRPPLPVTPGAKPVRMIEDADTVPPPKDAAAASAAAADAAASAKVVEEP